MTPLQPPRIPAHVRALLEELPPGPALRLLAVYAPDEQEVSPERLVAADRYLKIRGAIADLRRLARGRHNLVREQADAELARLAEDLADARKVLVDLGWFRAACGHAIDLVRSGDRCLECEEADQRRQVIQLDRMLEGLPSARERLAARKRDRVLA